MIVSLAFSMCALVALTITSSNKLVLLVLIEGNSKRCEKILVKSGRDTIGLTGWLGTGVRRGWLRFNDVRWG